MLKWFDYGRCCSLGRIPYIHLTTHTWRYPMNKFILRLGSPFHCQLNYMLKSWRQHVVRITLLVYKSNHCNLSKQLVEFFGSSILNTFWEWNLNNKVHHMNELIKPCSRKRIHVVLLCALLSSTYAFDSWINLKIISSTQQPWIA